MSNLFWKLKGELMYFLYLLLALVVLLMMVTIHEFGHYIAGKLLGFKINEFSIGFGKALFSKKKKNGEVFSIRLIPLGGYCAFEGEEDNSDNPQSFMKQKPWKRLIVLFAGAFFNFLSAIIFAVILLCSVGYDVPKITKITDVSNGVIVQRQEYLQENDIITHIDGVEISFIQGNTFNELIAKYEVDDTISMTIIRDGKKLNVQATVFEEVNSKGEKSALLGLALTTQPYRFGKALLLAVPFCGVMAWQILSMFGQLIIGKIAFSNLGGPITTITQIASLSMVGVRNFLILLPLLAVNLAVFNWLPIPALDGSKMVFTVIEMIRKKPINQKVENTIHTVGLILLFALVIIADLYHLIF